jgi:putative protease
MNKPELMSPAGYWPQLQTAIESGADAVYFGLNHFSARAKVGFSLEELPEVIQTLHQRDVKGFVTFNTLVFDHELEQAESAIEAIAQAGTDAIIVQDVGVVELIKAVAPELEIHGSTQMSITSAQGADFAASLGCSRVVLGRELSLKDIRKIAESTEVELETFVHGALCVSYSGQCFSSEAWGGRSANRGKCAQACRLSYDLIVDGEVRDLGPYRYLLSPGDLCSIDQIPELMDIGISCVKIEGRYKDSAYVAMTTRAYRDAIDLAAMDRSVSIEDEQRLDLEQIYSRGLGAHFMSGVDHQQVVQGRAPRHRGVKVGAVIQVKPKAVVVETEHEIRRGDGLVFDAADWRSPDEPEEGGNVYEVKPIGDASSDVSASSPQATTTSQSELVQLEFGCDDINFDRIKPGDLVWRTNDPKLYKRLKPLTHTEVPVFTRPISFDVTAIVGQPLKITASLESGLSRTFASEEPLAAAKKRGLDQDVVQEKLGRLGGTPFHLGQIKLDTPGDAFVPTSLLNHARRHLVDELFDAAGETQPIPATPVLDDELTKFKPLPTKKVEPELEHPQLHLLVRNGDQLDAALATADKTPIASITLDYLELYGLRPAVEKIRVAGIRPRVASPRILKPAEQKVVRFLQSLECDIVIRSAGLLEDLKQTELAAGCQLIGDFSLNIANAITAFKFLETGISRFAPTYDLNAQQITGLTQHVSADQIEVICYSHLPVFHMEHCVFCRFLSEGTDNTNCGHPCETHQIAVRDQHNRAHPVMADVGCRNTVFGAEAQTDIPSIPKWTAAGIRNYRLEFVHETAEQVAAIAESFGRFFHGLATESEVETVLAKNLSFGTTEGSLFVPKNFQDLIQLK